MYKAIAKSYDELHGAEQRGKLAVVKQNLNLKKGSLVLDVGCGTGISAEFFDKVIGLEPEFSLLRQAKCLKVQGIAEQLPFKDKAFDAVISITAIHNFDDYKKAINEIKRVAKGIVVISILKKSRNYNNIANEIKKKFKTIKIIDDRHDIIFFLTA